MAKTIKSVAILAKGELGVTGTSRYSSALAEGLLQRGIEVSIGETAGPPLPGFLRRGLRALGLDTEAFFSSYPTKTLVPAADVTHITHQSLATLLFFTKLPRPVVVTVHDIIPYLLRNDRKLNTYGHPVHRIFDHLALLGLRRAEALIAVSSWTKETLVQTLGIPHEKVHVVPEGVEDGVFRLMLPPQSFREKYGLDQNGSYILFVGVDDPRKNLANLLEAFAGVLCERPDVRLLKVGASKFPGVRQRLLTLCQELAIKDQVHFYDHVSEGDLPFFYNAASVFVYPSLFEGFGLPVLEAMACGTPVVCSNTTALAEVAGDAALQVDPEDHNAMAEALLRILDDPALAEYLARRGTERASRFTWATTAAMTAQVYEIVLGR